MKKNNILVSNVYNISQPGYVNLYYHNDFHNLWYDEGELYPKIQAGEDHGGSGTNHSLFDPLISYPPAVSGFSATQPNKIQLYFIIDDNASVKSYLLLQVKEASESNWHVLIDDQNQIWKFKAVDLTDYYKGNQRDYFHLLWDGKFEGGHYPGGNHNFNLKITVIDQGGNYCESVQNFSGTVAYPSIYISGPNYLNSGQLGTFTANPSGGTGIYTNYKWWERMDEENPESIASDNIILAPPPGQWVTLPFITQSIQISRTYSFSLKCEVTDSHGDKAEDIHSISVGGALAKTAYNNETQDDLIPNKISLFSNFPNPFNPTTTIKFGLPEDLHINITIYSSTGQKILTIVEGSYSKGYHEIKWDGRNHAGNMVSNGIYIYELRAGNHRLIKKMVFAK